MKKILIKLLHTVLISSLLLSSIPFSASASDHDPICDNFSQWSESNPPSYTTDECPNGLGFAAFNAFRNRPLTSEFGQTLTGDEQDFARIRKIYQNETGNWFIYNNGPTSSLGYSNQIRLTQPETELGAVYVYIHNGGDPEANPGQDDEDRYDVVAVDSRVKLSGFTKDENNHYVSEVGESHPFTVSITADNTIPVHDSFSIQTREDQYLELIPSSLMLTFCTNPNYDDISECDLFNKFANEALQAAKDAKNYLAIIQDEIPMTWAQVGGNNLLTSTGLRLDSRTLAQGAKFDFFASEGFRQQLYFYIRVKNVEPPLCNYLNIEKLTWTQVHPEAANFSMNAVDTSSLRPSLSSPITSLSVPTSINPPLSSSTLTATSSTNSEEDTAVYFRVEVDPDNPYLEDAVVANVSGEGGDPKELSAEEVQDMNPDLDTENYRYWVVYNTNPKTVITARVPEHEDDTTQNGCFDALVFEASSPEICKNLNLDILSGDPSPTDPNKVGDRVRFRVSANPSEYNPYIEVDLEDPDMAGDLDTAFGIRTYKIENWDGDTRVIALVPDELDGNENGLTPCELPLEFEAPLAMCTDLGIEVDPRDIDLLNPANEDEVGARIRFNVTTDPDLYLEDVEIDYNGIPTNEDDIDINEQTSSSSVVRNFTVEGWLPETVITAFVPGEENNGCIDTLEFNPPTEMCIDLSLENTWEYSPEFIGDTVEFTVETNPDSYLDDVEYLVFDENNNEVPGAEVEVITNLFGTETIHVTGWTEGSTLRAFVPGEEDCLEEVPFPSINQVCEDLQISEAEQTGEGEYRVEITELVGVTCTNEDLEIRVTGNGNASLHEGTPGDDCYVDLNNVDSTTEVLILAKDDPGTICVQPVIFPPLDECIDLNLSDPIISNEGYTFEASVNPSTFDIIFEVENANYTLDADNPNTITISDFDSNSVLRAQADGSDNPACAAEYTEFPDTENLCEDLSLTPGSFDPALENLFRFRADISPSNFESPVMFEVINIDTEEVLEAYTDNNPTYRFSTRNLDYNTKLRAYVDPEFVAEGYSCEAEILPPEYTPECLDLTVVRPGLPSGLNAPVCPSDGSPVVLVAAGYGNYEGPLVWTTPDACEPGSGPLFSDGINEAACGIVTDIDTPVVIRDCNPGQTIQVYAQEDPEDCYYEFTRDGDGDEPGDLFKEVVDSSFVGPETTQVRYRVTYTPNYVYGDIYSSVTIFDNIAQGLLGNNPEYLSLGVSPGILQLIDPNSFVITSEANIDFEGNLAEGLTIFGLEAGVPVSIEYTANLNSALRDSNLCEVLTLSCGEQYINTASTNYFQESSAQLNVLCPFIISRGFGDIYLEEDFNTGVDISRCSEKPNVEGPTFTPTTPDQSIPSTGAYDISGPSHHLCKGDDIPVELRELYGDDVLNSISSSVCEVGLTLAEKWQSNNITKDIEINIHKITRNLAPAQILEGVLSSLSENVLNKDVNQNYNVFLSEGDLTIGDGSTLVADGQAKTIIVRNGNLTINSDIEYAATQDPNNPPVIAFLVINGNIEIGPNVENLVGVYAAVKKDPGTGFIERSTGSSNKLLTIQGSVFGDLEPLFTQTTATGNLGVDRGAVSVIYDGRIVQNTPPGLKDIVEFNQYQVVSGSEIFDYVE